MRSIVTALLLLVPAFSQASDLCFWTDREKPLSAEEQQGLDTAKASTIYWQVGKLINLSGDWHWDDQPLRLPVAHQAVIPVARLTTTIADPFAKSDVLLGKLKEVVSQGAIVLDYDCPTGNFASYVAFLKELSAIAPKLGVIVQPSWIDNPQFAELRQVTSDLLPRFYQDEVAIQSAGPCEPAALLFRAESAKTEMEKWGHEKLAWRAILPNFVRAAAYDSTSVPKKFFHDWSWNDVLLDPALSPVKPMKDGLAVLTTAHALQMGPDNLRSTEQLVISQLDRPHLQQAIQTAEASGAAGVILRLPDKKPETGWSLAQLADLSKTEPTLTLKAEGNHLVLADVGTTDLAARCETSEDRGYLLEVSSSEPIYSSATEGDFFDVTGLENPGEKDFEKHDREQTMKGNFWQPVVKDASLAVPPTRARRLQFSFPALRSGNVLQTGVIRLIPGASFSLLRYRILPFQPEWKPVEMGQSAAGAN